MKKLIAFFALSAVALTLGACNTIEGMGKDIKKGGEAVEKAAEKAKS